MVSEKEVTSLSKFISLVLRHNPGAIGLVLDENGWADTSALIDKMNKAGKHITPALLEHIVATNAKKRFAFNEDKTKIRASQGHSINIDLQLTPVEPPAILYHGTGERSVTCILQSGLEKRNRQWVHLSADVATAVAVGRRHGKPVVLTVDAATMHKEGRTFYLSANGVWLTESVPAKYIRTV
ncbi:RNA 2'-phosphotransferase [Segetibacter aerophilus]|uniref:Probable RNA 2'-phosphotransferase n=1 Tax=Segetibacter aerophilus TaxID=670293 RepID=A0A512BG85_9BACT|nr:RNA 2'-phosphotransferase [Segetibacter aerophilus]GEO10979.1 putative RNA 2'-phosphotransferase [Segetibacter aerophilus]